MRLPAMSKSALAAVLDAVDDQGVPELHRREHMVEGLDRELERHNVYGPIILERTLSTKSGEQQPVLYRLYSNFLSLLHGAVSQGGSYDELVLESFQRVRCGPDHLWNLCIYMDEAVPGNPLANLLTRKSWVIYGSFLEFGQKALSREPAWLVLAIIRSSQVNLLAAGMSQVVATLLKMIFCSGFDPRHAGIVLQTSRGPVRIYFRPGMHLMDGGAHKVLWCIKADAGCRYCMICLNVFLTRAAASSVPENEEAEDDDPRDGLVCGLCKRADLVMATDADVLKASDRLALRARTCRKGEFEMWQKASGLLHEPKGLMQDPELRREGLVAPRSQYCHDWMHTTCSAGIMQLLVFLLFAAVASTQPTIWKDFGVYIGLWILPGAYASDLSRLFSSSKVESYKKAKTFKCQASEMLGIFPILQHYCFAILIPQGTCIPQCKAFIAMPPSFLDIFFFVSHLV
jgi:hypothetical protein